MSVELSMLRCSVWLGIVHLLVATSASMKQRPFKWNLSPRDVKLPDLAGVPGRLDRAFKNFKETFVFFVAAVCLVTFTKTENSTSALGAQLYLWARLLYVPIYAAGIPVLRTIVWFAATVGIGMVLCALCSAV